MESTERQAILPNAEESAAGNLAMHIGSLEVLVEQQKGVLEMHLAEQMGVLQSSMRRQQEGLQAICRAMKIPSGLYNADSCLKPCQASSVSLVPIQSGTSTPNSYVQASNKIRSGNGLSYSSRPYSGADADGMRSRSVSPDRGPMSLGNLDIARSSRSLSPSPSESSNPFGTKGNKMRPFAPSTRGAEAASGAPPFRFECKQQVQCDLSSPETKLVEVKASQAQEVGTKTAAKEDKVEGNGNEHHQHLSSYMSRGHSGLPTANFRKKHHNTISALQKAQGWKGHRDPQEDDEDDLGESSGESLKSDDVHSKIARFEGSYGWTMACIIVIILNAAVNGLETDMRVKQALYSEPFLGREGAREFHNSTGMEIFVDLFNVACYLWLAAEVGLRVYVQRCRYFSPKLRLWNLFDVFILVWSTISLAEVGFNVVFLRMLRVFRLIRAVRVFRLMHRLQTARKMFVSIVGSLNSLFWMFIFVFIIMFFTSIVILQGLAICLDDALPQMDEEEIRTLEYMYGGIAHTLYSLFGAITGGNDWHGLVEPLIRIHPFFLVVFLMYLIFTVFGVLNVLTGMFVNVAMCAARDDRQTAIQSQLEEQDSCVNKLRDLFRNGDSATDGNGTISKDEFLRLAEKPIAKAYLGSMGLKVGEAEGLFELLDTDGSGDISIEEFISNCLRLKGEATAVDVVTLIHESKKLANRINAMKDGTEDCMEHVSAQLKRLEVDTKDRLQRLDFEVTQIKDNLSDHFKV